MTMKSNSIYLLFLILFLSALSGHAQNGLEIEKIFNGVYASDPNVTETMINGNNKFLKSHKLSVLATFKGPASTYESKIEALVLKDGASAIGKNVRYKEGKLYFALYVLPPQTVGNTKRNRYLYYLNNAANKGSSVMVVYLEGSIKDTEVSELIRSLAKK